MRLGGSLKLLCEQGYGLRILRLLWQTRWMERLTGWEKLTFAGDRYNRRLRKRHYHRRLTEKEKMELPTTKKPRYIDRKEKGAK